MSEQSSRQPKLPQEVLDTLNYDIQIADQEVFLSSDEAWEVKQFIRGIGMDHPYRPLFLDIDEQYKRTYPTEEPIHLVGDKVLALAGTYVGMFWAADKTDALEVQKLRYKVDKVLGGLPEGVQEALKKQMEEGDK